MSKEMSTEKQLICSLCQMHFVSSDSLLITRLKRHTEFHEKARIHGRNTACGSPEYIVKGDHDCKHHDPCHGAVLWVPGEDYV